MSFVPNVFHTPRLNSFNFMIQGRAKVFMKEIIELEHVQIVPEAKIM